MLSIFVAGSSKECKLFISRIGFYGLTIMSFRLNAVLQNTWVICLALLPSNSLETVIQIESLSPLIENFEYARQLSYHLSNLCQTVFPERLTVTILQVNYNERVVSFLEHFLESRMISVLNIDTEKCYSNGYWKCIDTLSQNDIVFMFMTNWEDLLHSVVERNAMFLNSRAHYIFIWDSPKIESNSHNLSVILPKVFGTNCYKVIVIHVPKRPIRNELSSEIQTKTRMITIMSHKPLTNLYYTDSISLQTLHERNSVFTDVFDNTGPLNLYGNSLRVTTLHDVSPPYFSLLESNKSLSYHGYVPKMMEALSTYMNFTMDIVRVYGINMYGYKNENGSWEGVIGDLAVKQADISYSSIAVNLERCEVAEFSETYGIDPSSLLVSKSKRIPPWEALATIYQVYVLLSIIVMLVILNAIAKLLQLFTMKGNDFSPVALNLFGVLFQVSVQQPNGNSLRILFFVWVYFSLVIGAIYTGAIVSVLTIPSYYPDIKDLEELDQFEIAIRGHRFYRAFFDEKSNDVLLSLFERYQIGGSYEETLNMMQRGDKIAMISTKYVIEYYARKMKSCSSCSEEFHLLKESLGILIRSVAFPKGSPYIMRVSELIIRMRESGLLSKWRSDEIEQALDVKVCDTECNSNKVISLEDLQLNFYVLFVGNFIGIMSCVCETMYSMSRGSGAIFRIPWKQQI